MKAYGIKTCATVQTAWQSTKIEMRSNTEPSESVERNPKTIFLRIADVSPVKHKIKESGKG